MHGCISVEVRSTCRRIVRDSEGTGSGFWEEQVPVVSPGAEPGCSCHAALAAASKESYFLSTGYPAVLDKRYFDYSQNQYRKQ